MNVKMDKKFVALVIGIKVITVLIGSTFLVAPAFAGETICDSDMTTLVVSSQADVNAAPDIAEVTAGVMTTALTAQDALKQNSEKMNAVFAALKKVGVAEKDIQTSGINVNAQYNYQDNQSPKVIGYQAVNNVNVRFRDLKNVGPILDTLVAQGANQLNGPNFTVENPDPLLDGARKEAVEKAKKRAELYAAAAGMKVKRIITLSEQSGIEGPRPYAAMKVRAMAADAAPTPVAAGEVNLNVTVNVTYELTQ